MTTGEGTGRKTALLGVGGNIGDPPATMAAALQALDARSDVDVAKVSLLYRTPPWGLSEQPDFYNACVAVETGLTARELLDLCLKTERDFKRERRLRWGPRTLDLDILDHAGETVFEEALVLPHPRMAERAFVLVPLADIAPGHVLSGMTVAARAAAIERSGIEAVSEDGDWWRPA